MTDNTQQAALKPCPFCGSHEIRDGSAVIRCAICGGCAPSTRWNARATPVSESHAALAEKLEAVGTALLNSGNGLHAVVVRTAVRALRAHPAGGVSEDVVKRAAQAYSEEWKRWIGRSNWDPDQYEVCRLDDSGIAGSFSEVHAFQIHKDAGEALERMRSHAGIRAALRAAGIGAGVDGVVISHEMNDFLHGSGPLKGKWFGELHPHHSGAYWWRRFLPRSRASTPAAAPSHEKE